MSQKNGINKENISLLLTHTVTRKNAKKTLKGFVIFNNRKKEEEKIQDYISVDQGEQGKKINKSMSKILKEKKLPNDPSLLIYRVRIRFVNLNKKIALDPH